MKKYSFLFFIVFLSACQVHKKIDFLENVQLTIKPWQYYHALAFETEEEGKQLTKESAFILEIEEPVFRKVKRRFTKTELEQKTPIRIAIRPAHRILVFRNENLEATKNHYKAEDGYIFYVMEYPKKHKIFTTAEITEEGYEIEVEELIKEAQIIKKEVRSKPKKLSPNQKYFEAAYWRELRRGLVLEGYYVRPQVTMLVQRLMDFGYPLEGKTYSDKEVKAALLDFQEKNGLPIGQLDYETLKALGVQY